MLVKFDAKLNKDTRKDVWINPEFVVSVVDSYPKSNEGHSELTTCAMVGEDESECWVVKGKAEDVVIRLNHYSKHIPAESPQQRRQRALQQEPTA